MQQFKQNFFELFEIPESFDLDNNLLSEKYHNKQIEVHPDKFVGSEEKVKLQAVQLTSYLNEAYSTLQSPLKRAAYLLKLRGMDVEAVNQSELSMDLLMEQMQLRESLDELPKDESSLPELDKLKDDVNERLLKKHASFGEQIDQEQIGQEELAKAKQIFHELQFLHKLLAEIELGEEQRLGY